MITLALRAALQLPLAAIAIRAGGVHAAAARRLRTPGRVRVDEARARAIAAAVHRAAGLLWPRPSCLTRALAIARLLSREGLAARVTIGVAHGPFAAHAWLDHGPLRLAGADPIRAYEPLGAIDAGETPAFVAAP